MTSSGHIYKIICTLDEKFCYIGSTFNRLSKRFEIHRKSYIQWKQGDEKVKCSCFDAFDKYGVENFKIILIKTYEVCRSHVKDRKHLEAYETLWINKSKCVNKIVAFNPLLKNKRFNNIRTCIYYHNNPEKKREKCKIWYVKNKDKCHQKYIENRDENLAKARAHHHKNRDERKAKQSVYNESHRDEINAKMREHYAKNRDEINAKRRAKKKAEKEAQITV